MRIRLLGLSLLATVSSGVALAAAVHPYADQMLALTVPERNLVTAYLNASPVLGAPRIGENAKEVFVEVEKILAYSQGATKPYATTTCTTTVTNSMTVINVSLPDVYLYKTQTIKMSPVGCAIEDDGSIDIEGVFPDGVTSEVRRVSGFFPELADALAQWESWSISGKNLKYSWQEESEEGAEIYYMHKDAGVVNLGATSFLCADTAAFVGVASTPTTDDNGRPIILVATNTRTSKPTCSAAKPVLGKVNTDIMSIEFNDGTRFCSESGDSETCSLDPVELEFPEQLLPLFPSDSAQ